jgi:acyl-CoA synthetase (AMP-forming)/AMP-acid ligase II
MWCARWDTVTDPAGLYATTRPPFVDFATSGTTGAARTWRRTGENLWREAGMLADLIRPDRPEAIVSFAPTVHLFGALTSVLVPAHLRIPVWFRTGYAGAMPGVPGGRVAVVATPWIFQLLLGQMDWVRRFEHVTVLYGGAALPGTAGEFLRKASGRAAIVEVMGSTEAGGVATRRWHEGEPPPWTLWSDVEFAGMVPGEEGALTVRSPRLAFPPDAEPPARWVADDLVVPLDERTFRLVGRVGRLVKVNGRRIDLDAAEQVLRAAVDCVDLALVPVRDEVIGEHVELLIVPHPAMSVDLDLSEVTRRIGVRPRRVTRVGRIERSALGKAKATAIPANREAAGTADRRTPNREAAEAGARTGNREKAEVVTP